MVIILSIVSGVFLRFYNLKRNVEFGWDQETTAMTIFEMVKNKKPVLIGPRIGPGKFFLGPFYYYLASLFLIAFNFQPLGLYISSVFFGLVTGAVLYFFSREFFDQKTALLATSLYFLSPLLLYFDRVPWNVNLLILTSCLVIWGIDRIFLFQSQKIKYFLILGLGLGLGMQAHLTAVFLVVLFLIYFTVCLFLKRIKLNKKLSWIPLILLFFLLPLIIFDLRHDFFNLKAVSDFFLSNASNAGVKSKSFYLGRVYRNFLILLELVGKVILGQEEVIYEFKLLLGAVLLFYLGRQIFLSSTQLLKEKYQLILAFLIIPLFLLGFYKGEVPEYYFLFNVPFILILMADLLKKELKILKPKNVFIKQAFILLLIFLIRVNFNSVKKNNQKSLYFKEALVNYIVREVEEKEVKINYDMATVGLIKGHGFPYLFKLKNINQVDESNLEVVIKYPFVTELMREEEKAGYEKFGAYGLMIERK